MAYKKYIKRNGKIYGPYIYHSKRVDGRVISEYKGQGDGVLSERNKKFLFVIGAFIAILFLVFFVFQDTRFTGRSVINLNTERVGDSIVGDLEFVMYGGELIPVNSSVVIENEGEVYDFVLSDILGGETLEGNYYLEGVNLDGSGEGYGLIGEREVSEKIFFDLELFELVEVQDGNETFEEEVSADSVSFDLSSGEEVRYSIEGYSDYSISNVRNEIESLSSSILNVEEVGDELIITTDYLVVEEGFGRDYLTDFEKTYSVDVSSFGVDLVPGSLSFEMSYDGVNIVDYETTIEGNLSDSNETGDETNETVDLNESLENETSEDFNESVDLNETDDETNETVDLNESLENETSEDFNESVDLNESEELDNVTETIIQESVFDDLFLNSLEKRALNDYFDSDVVVSKAVDYNRRVIVTFSLESYSVSNSYNDDLNDTEIMKVMSRDRILWLKDLAREINSSGESSQSRDELNDFYQIN